MTERAVNADEIAELLAVHRSTIYSLARSGAIPAFKVGRMWRFFPSQVIAHLNRPRDPWAKRERGTLDKRPPDPWALPSARRR